MTILNLYKEIETLPTYKRHMISSWNNKIKSFSLINSSKIVHINQMMFIGQHGHHEYILGIMKNFGDLLDDY